jgi:S-adenosyl-L-methionine hydrolase (adenosine-forming)
MTALITLSTDFGTRDSYVAELKGVLLSEGPPDLRVIDLSHELAPFDVQAAAWFARVALPRFPAGTVHLVVVDPGVGSTRRALVVQLPMMTLVGPDNGVFSQLYDGREQVYAIDPGRLGTRSISRTFHGRDLFAPVAAQLAAGVSAASLGPRIETYQRMGAPLVEMVGDVLHGHVMHVDHFGNLISDLSEATLRDFLGLDGALSAAPERLRVRLGEHVVKRVVDHYAEAEPGQLIALVGSSGLLELSLREASAALELGIGVGHTVSVTRRG